MPDSTPVLPPLRDVSVERTLFDRITDATSVGFAWSVLIHALLLIAMALIIFPIASDDGVVAVVATDVEEFSNFDDVADVSIDTSGADQAEAEQVVELTPDVADVPLPVATTVNEVAKAESQSTGEGKSTGEGQGGRRLAAPSNAVRRGRFSAWTIPIREFANEVVRPGDSPRPGQDYHIVIQLQLPENVQRYLVSDLRGTVVGTDGYRLQLPNKTYYYDEDGNLRAASGRKRLPITDHVVQILVHVPGAKYAAVRDRIAVSSRRLAESQELELVFEQANRDNMKDRFR